MASATLRWGAALLAVGAAVACATSVSSTSSAPMCGNFAVTGACSIAYALSPSTQAGCSALPPAVLELESAESTFTSASGQACKQTFEACAMTRTCSDAAGDSFAVDLKFTGNGAYTGSASQSTSGTTCKFTVSGACPVGSDAGVSSSGSSGGGSGAGSECRGNDAQCTTALTHSDSAE